MIPKPNHNELTLLDIEVHLLEELTGFHTSTWIFEELTEQERTLLVGCLPPNFELEII